MVIVICCLGLYLIIYLCNISCQRINNNNLECLLQNDNEVDFEPVDKIADAIDNATTRKFQFNPLRAQLNAKLYKQSAHQNCFFTTYKTNQIQKERKFRNIEELTSGLDLDQI